MHVATRGGTQTCEVCSAEHEVVPREERAAPPCSLSEDERVARLRRGDAALPGMPPDVSRLTRAGGALLEPQAADEAMSLWQKTRGDLDAEPTSRARFFHLTMLLYRHMKAQKDDLQLRGVLESAIEATAGHRDQQILRCVISRAAARAGDLPAAEDWVAPCDARSDDLHADGAYRYTVAYIATHKKQFARVLEVLGMRVGEVPLAENLDVICSVLRANGHERLDDLEAATYELADCMGRAPGGAAEVEAVIRNTGDLVLCRQSFVRARRLHDQLAPSTVVKTPPSAGPSLRVAIPCVIASLFFLGLAVSTDAGSTFSGGRRLDLLFYALAISFAVPLVVLFLRKPRP